MKAIRKQNLLAVALMGGLVACTTAQAQTAESTYKFERDFPTAEAAQKAHDDADYQRAVTAYRFWFPTVTHEGVFNGLRELGVKDNESVGIFMSQPHHVFFTPNSDTPYGFAVLDLKAGPMVIELPPGNFICIAMDHNEQWILDMGLPGPDKGQGGKHLIVPRDYKGEVPKGYCVGKSATYKFLAAIRALPSNGDLKGALESLRKIKIYPLSTAASPVTLKFVDFSDKPADMTALKWEDNIQYWQRLHGIIDYEPLVEEFGPMYGELKALGIEKGKPFNPDARMTGILTRAAKDARDQLLVSAFASTRPDRVVWPDRSWEWASLNANYDFKTDNGPDLEARDRWMAHAQGSSPAMFSRSPGAGSLYWLGFRDKQGAYLDGGKTYKLSVPLPVPARLFWSVTTYDADTRSEIQTDQDKAALRSMVEMKDAAGTSAELYFGPNAPDGQEGHWIKTSPGKGWFVFFRIYGPEGPAFDGTWKPGDFELVK